MSVQKNRMRLLYLMEILSERTDENNLMNADELTAALQGYGISADRKSIYNDIEALQTFGIDIIQRKGRASGYYMASRGFELAELKLLVDAVQASKFITSRKSKELIQKLSKFAGKSEKGQLNRQVFIYNRPKTGNETIYYNVDCIHNAISEDRRVRFQYREWTVRKELRLKHDGAYYEVSPWALTWDDENYYMIAYDEQTETIRHYRVDKICHMECTQQRRRGEDYFRDFDLALFSKKTFGMYGGYDASVSLICDNELTGVVLDRFGSDVAMFPIDEAHFKVSAPVTVSRQFFGWVTGVGSGMQIAGPERVRGEYREYLEEIMGKYLDK